MCKYKKVQLPNVRPGKIDVEALIRSLEARNASKRAPQATESRQEAPAAAAAPAPDSAVPERMSDEEIEKIAGLLKMARSTASARQWGLRLLVETRRAREAEERLTRRA